MKRIIYILFITALVSGFYSCDKDNYDEPDAQINGRILDPDGNSVQTEQGSSTNYNVRIKMEELSWAHGDSTIAIIPTYLNVRQDGSYVNTKIFSGQYRMTPVEGAFYPYDAAGEIVDIKGNVTKDFTVIPYLDVSWISEPTLTSDNKITCSIQFTRNVKSGAIMPDLSNTRLFISTTQYVGNNNYDSQISSSTVNLTNTQEGQTITLTSNALKYTGMTYYVRVGACCNDSYKKYNYTDIKQLTVR